MPRLTMRVTSPCELCGCRLQGFRIGTYRINKHSLVGERGGIGWAECPECGPSFSRRNPTGVRPDPKSWRLDAESLAVVNAHRARKGWPTHA